MDQERQIRFLIPPFVLIFSLITGAYLGGYDLMILFKKDSDLNILLVFFAGAASIIALGFIISTISINLLRLISFLFGKYTYEAILDEMTLKHMWKKINTSSPFDVSKILFLAATYDHEILSSGIHEWIMRRWNSFNISLHSFLSLVLSHLIGPVFKINQSYNWILITILFGVLFLINAIKSWKETMGMIEFQSYRLDKNNRLTRSSSRPHFRLGRLK